MSLYKIAGTAISLPPHELLKSVFRESIDTARNGFPVRLHSTVDGSRTESGSWFTRRRR